MRVRRAVFGGETERGLGRVRRPRPHLEQQRATLRAPAARQERAPQLDAREVGVVGAQARERHATQRLERFAWCAPRRAAPCRARAAGARARPRYAAAAPLRTARRARACLASGARGYSRSRRSKAAAAAARSPRASCCVPSSSSAAGACPGTPRARSRAAIALSFCPARSRSSAAFGRAAHTTALPGSSAAASAACRRLAAAGRAPRRPGRPRGTRGRGAGSCRCRGG